jgi:pimeloyl-ACP methyl ester carboxylesterase
MKRVNPPLYNQSYINEGNGPVVILLHGLFGNLRIWRDTINALKKDFQVIVPRLPLFELPVEHTNIRYLAQALHEFIDWNQLTDINIVGHALGGQVALMYTQLNPQNVNKLVLTSSVGLMGSPYPETDSFSGSYEYIQDRVEEAFYQKEFVSEKLVNEIYSTVQNIPNRLALGMIARSSKQVNVSSFLGKIDHPVLLVWGLHDKITSPETALHFHDLLPNSDIKFIDRCGHLPMIEKPDQFNKHLLLFFQEKNRFKKWYDSGHSE